VDEALSKSVGNWYEDDGVTAGTIEKGQFQVVNFSYHRKKNIGQLNISSVLPSGKHFVNQSSLVIHLGDEQPSKVILNTKKIPFELSENGTITIPLTEAMLQKAEIEFHWK
jgi:hypothetical protein